MDKVAEKRTFEMGLASSCLYVEYCQCLGFLLHLKWSRDNFNRQTEIVTLLVKITSSALQCT